MAYIRRILVEPFRCVPRLDIDLGVDAPDAPASVPEAPPFRHLIITGPNGSGKTSLITKIAEYVQTQLQRASDPFYARSLDELAALFERARVAQEVPVFDPREFLIPGLAIRWDRPWHGVRSEQSLLQVFRTARQVLRVTEVKTVEKGLFSDAARASASVLLQYLVNLKAEQAFLLTEGKREEADAIEHYFSRLQSLIRRVLQDDRAELAFVRPDYNFIIKRSDGLSFDFNQLADGHAAALAVVAELTLRIDITQRAMKDPTFQPEGVVFVDEIEAHLHPTMQQEILAILTEFFPTLQFIVATHSPAVIASVPYATVLDLGSQKTVRSEDLMGLRYGAILKGYFGLPEDLDTDTSERLQRLRTLARLPSRTGDEAQEFEALADALSQRSAELGTEIWLLRNGLAERTKQAS